MKILSLELGRNQASPSEGSQVPDFIRKDTTNASSPEFPRFIGGSYSALRAAKTYIYQTIFSSTSELLS